MGICMSQGSAMDANVSEEDKRLHREAEKQLKEVGALSRPPAYPLNRIFAGQDQAQLAGQGASRAYH